MEREKSTVKISWSQFTSKKEKAVLVGLYLPRGDKQDVLDSLEELRLLAKTAGAVVEKVEVTKREGITPNFYVGKGKAEEIAKLCQEKNIDVVIFDDDLTPAQIKNLQDLFGVKVIDRTELILDIFALHAKSREGKIQVQLAQLQYMLPRLVHAWTHLSRQAGGIGARRGPGEKQLEVDRRRIRQQITKLSRDLERVHGHRNLQRKFRERKGIPLVSIIGYTNAGKTTLFNRLTESNLPVEDKLFTTLDPKLNRCKLPNKQMILVSDTVGFIKKLPHHLVESFKATLEEVYEADILLHVIDGAAPMRMVEGQYDVVMNLLKELNVISKPIITVINKTDLLTDSPEIVYPAAESLGCKPGDESADRMELQIEDTAPSPHRGVEKGNYRCKPVGLHKLTRKIPDSVPLSAKEGTGIDDLLENIQSELQNLSEEIELFIPSSHLGIISKIYNAGTVVEAKYTNKGANITAELPKINIGEFKEWIV